ncbi:hypothetical protein J7E96_28380 [Streptomyces sp. ISL-96]|nr:hypothetical protein [Streptomyces sp. ISL-96]MBT2492358.1 hypothetical protein [Streptomyces sp. ISL-96]
MIHVVLAGGLVGLALALYAKASDIRFLGGLTALAGLAFALLNWEAW